MPGFQNAFSGWHLVIVLAVLLLIFAPKLPGMARSIAQSMKIFKKEIRSDDDDTPASGTEGSASASTERNSSGSTTP